MNPGTFPIFPTKASYYINLAGGFDPAKMKSAYTIIDKYGNKVANDETVPGSCSYSKVKHFQAG